MGFGFVQITRRAIIRGVWVGGLSSDKKLSLGDPRSPTRSDANAVQSPRTCPKGSWAHRCKQYCGGGRRRGVLSCPDATANNLRQSNRCPLTLRKPTRLRLDMRIKGPSGPPEGRRGHRSTLTIKRSASIKKTLLFILPYFERPRAASNARPRAP